MGSRLNETFTQNKMRNRRSNWWTESPPVMFYKCGRIQPQNLRTCLDLLILILYSTCCPISSISLPMMFLHFLAALSPQFTFFICQLRWAQSSHLAPWSSSEKTDWLMCCWQWWQGRTETMVWRLLTDDRLLETCPGILIMLLSPYIYSIPHIPRTSVDRALITAF